MEKIKERNMTTFVLSSLINFGIGAAFGLIVSIINVVSENNSLWEIISRIFVFKLFARSTWDIIWHTSIEWGIIVLLFALNMYRLYFYYRLSLDINEVCKGDGQESESYVIAFVLSNLTFGLYRIYWAYKLGQRLHVNAPRYGFKMPETGKDIAVLDALSFGYIAAWELIKNMNRIVKVYNQTGLAEVVGGVQ